MKKSIRIVFLVVLVTGSAFSQARQITKDEFSRIYFSALEKASEIDRRVTSELEHYKGGKVSETEEWDREYSASYKWRLVYQETTPGTRKRIEEINIDGTSFCKFDDQSFEKRTTNCLKGFIALMSQASQQVGGIISSQFTVENTDLDGVKCRLFKEYTAYRNQAPGNSDGEKRRFLENRFWLNDGDLVVKQETRSGLIGEKEISSLWVDVYDYNPKDLLIEMPIK